MKYFLLVLLGLSMVMAKPMVQPKTDEEAGVLVLTTQNFDDALKDNKYIMVEFYAPWCGHCKKLTPEWQKAAFALQSNPTPVKLGKVDATVESSLGKRFNVKGYPTLLFFVDGQQQDQTGGRTGEEIYKWLTKKVGDFSFQLTTSEQVEEFKKDNKVGLVYFTSQTEGNNWKAFESVAKYYDKLSFSHVTDEKLAQEQGVKLGDLVLFKQFDEGKNVYTAETFKRSEITKFVDENSIAVLMEFDEIAVQAVFHKRNPTLFLFNNGTPKAKEYLKLMQQAAPQNKGGKLIYAVTSPTDGHGQWTQLANYLRVDTKEAPFFMIVHATTTENIKKRLEGEVTTESLQNFIDEFNGTSGKKTETKTEKKSEDKSHVDL